MKDFEYKSGFHSLKECKDYIRNIASNIDYSENESILTSVFHYLEEYEHKLKTDYNSNLKILFKVKCNVDTPLNFFKGITKDCIYDVIEIKEDSFVIKNDLNELKSIEKKCFIKI